MNTFIYSFVIINAVLIWYFGFENAACQIVGTHWKYFVVGGKVSSTKEGIYDGRTWERNGDPRITVGDSEQEEVMKLKYFNMDDGCQYTEKQLRYFDKGWSSSMEFGTVANISSPQNLTMLRTIK